MLLNYDSLRHAFIEPVEMLSINAAQRDNYI
jgi:hypothetical protein